MLPKLKKQMLREISNTKKEITKSNRETKDKEGTRILDMTTTAATKTVKIIEIIATSNIAYEKLKSFSDFISGINNNIDKQT